MGESGSCLTPPLCLRVIINTKHVIRNALRTCSQGGRNYVRGSEIQRQGGFLTTLAPPPRNSAYAGADKQPLF